MKRIPRDGLTHVVGRLLENLVNYIFHSPVPETDTGRLVEDTEGRERTLSKELGKMAP